VAVADVVIVAYNSGGTLRNCVEPLCSDPAVSVIVVDNASPDRGLASVLDLSVTTIPLGANHGFAFGCNRGWESGSAPFVLFLNPDARIERDSLMTLVAALERNDSVGAVAPRLMDATGSLELSQRRFPRARSTFAQAVFLHRVFPRASWAGEVVNDPSAYQKACAVEWVSGACVLIRRSALERLGGWDEGFFLYGEDKDICRRLWSLGYEVFFEPDAEAIHIGGASAPRPQLLATLAASRIRYAAKHQGQAGAAMERVGVALGAFTHMLLTTKGHAARAGHLGALRTACSRVDSGRHPFG
jgi:GT2 family glycosyltransferase